MIVTRSDQPPGDNLVHWTSLKIDTYTDTLYNAGMIKTFKHRGLKRLFERGDQSKVSAKYLARIEDVLARLDIADIPNFLDLPGYELHRLKGNLKGTWSIKISGNWRIIFRLTDGDAFDVDLIDYH